MSGRRGETSLTRFLEAGLTCPSSMSTVSSKTLSISPCSSSIVTLIIPVVSTYYALASLEVTLSKASRLLNSSATSRITSLYHTRVVLDIVELGHNVTVIPCIFLRSLEQRLQIHHCLLLLLESFLIVLPDLLFVHLLDSSTNTGDSLVISSNVADLFILSGQECLTIVPRDSQRLSQLFLEISLVAHDPAALVDHFHRRVPHRHQCVAGVALVFEVTVDAHEYSALFAV